MGVLILILEMRLSDANALFSLGFSLFDSKAPGPHYSTGHLFSANAEELMPQRMWSTRAGHADGPDGRHHF